MKTENLERIKTLMIEIAEICQEEKEKYLSLTVMNTYISINNSVKPKRKNIFTFSNDRGRSWLEVK